METLTDKIATARFRTMLELFDAGVDLQRQNIRRRFPDADDVTVEKYLRAWLLRENEPGDAEGVPGSWPRQKE